MIFFDKYSVFNILTKAPEIIKNEQSRNIFTKLKILLEDDTERATSIFTPKI